MVLPYCFDPDCCDPEERSEKAEALNTLHAPTLVWAGFCTECLRPVFGQSTHSIHCSKHPDPVPLLREGLDP